LKECISEHTASFLLLNIRKLSWDKETLIFLAINFHQTCPINMFLSLHEHILEHVW